MDRAGYMRLSGELIRTQERAKDDPERRAFVEINGEHLEVDARSLTTHAGHRRWPFVVRWQGCTILLSLNPDGAKDATNGYFQMPGEACTRYGAVQLLERWKAFMQGLGVEEFQTFIRRGDACRDYLGQSAAWITDVVWNNQYLARTQKVIPHKVGKVKTGATIGDRGRACLRCYDKAHHLRTSENVSLLYKEAIAQRWGCTIETLPDEALRVEFEFRTDYLKEHGIESVEQFLDQLPGLCGKMLRLDNPFFKPVAADEETVEAAVANRNQGRLPVDPRWATLVTEFLSCFKHLEPVRRVVKTAIKNVARLGKQIRGLCESVARAGGYLLEDVDDYWKVFDKVVPFSLGSLKERIDRQRRKAVASGVFAELVPL